MPGWGLPYEKFTTDWAEGVHASAHPDLIPDNASPRAWNAAWDAVGDATAIVRQRRGIQRFTASALTAGGLVTPIIGQVAFQRMEASGAFTRHQFMIGQGGTLAKVAPDGTWTTVSEIAFNGVPSAVSFVTANNHLYLVTGFPIAVAGGTSGNGLAYDGKSWTKVGLDIPDTPTAISATGSGDMTGDYDVVLTYYNQTKGTESGPCSSSTASCSSQQLAVSWDAPRDTQVTHVRVYLRKQTISTTFYKAAEVAVASLTTTLNVSDDTYNTLIVEVPAVTDHAALPAGTKLLAWWRNRLFAATDQLIYYSSADSAEAFDLTVYEDPSKDDGQRLTGLFVLGDALIVLKEDSVFRISGTGPNDWVTEQISGTTGCIAPKSIVLTDGAAYWWSDRGPVVWQGEGEPNRIGMAAIADLIGPDSLNYSLSGPVNTSLLSQIQGVHDALNERILWAVPQIGSIRNNMILPFKYRLGRFEGQWFVVDVASWCETQDQSGQPRIFLGDYYGRLFRWWQGDNDGLPATGVTSGSFTATGATHATLTGTGLATDLAGLYVYLQDSTGRDLGRRKIASQTGTTALTLATAFNGLSTGEVYSWQVGAIDFQFDLKWQHDGAPFKRKRYEFLYTQVRVPALSTLYVDLGYDYSEAPRSPRALTITPGLSSAVWGTGTWDSSSWGLVVPTHLRTRMAHTGWVWRARFRHRTVNVPFSLLKVGVCGEFLTDKR